MSTDMQIVITRGIGTAGTCLAAFDAALDEAGIANLNLITLSSVIPPGATITTEEPGGGGWDLMGAGWGDRLYCVLAEARVDKPGQEAWAGLAWWQADDNRGLFVEQHGHGKQEVMDELTLSIVDCVERRGLHLDDGRWGMVVEGTACIDQPVCALVAATYETQGWV